MENIIVAPIIVELSTEILDTLPIDKVLYAEYAMPDAKGNAGEVMLYIIKDRNLICYKTNIFNNESIYNKAINDLKRNQFTSRYKDVINEDGIFKFYSGGYGNNVLINKNISLEIRHGYFVYYKDDKKYILPISTREVFEHVFSTMRRHERIKRAGQLIDLLSKGYINEAKKQSELLQEKIDKEIIEGKMYTKKENDAILRICCKSQNYISFRRGLIYKGYLN